MFAALSALLFVGGAPAGVKLTPVEIPGMAGPQGLEYRNILDGPRLNASGRALFTCRFNGMPDQGLTVWEEGVPSLLVAVNQEAPGLPPTIPPRPYFKSFGLTFQGDDGSYIFEADLAGTDIDDSNNAGLWAAGPDGVLALVAWEGDRAAGQPDGYKYVRPFDWYPVMGDSGVGAF